jgi:hypothetical protein
VPELLERARVEDRIVGGPGEVHDLLRGKLELELQRITSPAVRAGME